MPWDGLRDAPDFGFRPRSVPALLRTWILRIFGRSSSRITARINGNGSRRNAQFPLAGFRAQAKERSIERYRRQVRAASLLRLVNSPTQIGIAAFDHAASLTRLARNCRETRLYSPGTACRHSRPARGSNCRQRERLLFPTARNRQ